MSRQLKILFLEDVSADAELESRELRRGGLDCVMQRVETREAFVRALDEFEPDVILSDFSLPTFDGLSALDIAQEKRPDAPFLFVSGTIGEERAIEALKRGATDYILKTNLRRLAPAVRRAMQDVEERAARRRAEQEVAEQREFYRSVIDLDRNFIFAKDREGRFTLANQALAEAYGCSVNDLLAKTDADFNPNREEVEHFRKLDLEVMDTLREAFIPEERITDAAGRVRWLQTVKRPLVSADGTANMVLGVSTDITERKTQELKIGRLNRVLSVLSGINSAIVRIRDRQELFNEACRIAVEHGEFGIAWIGVLNQETLEITPAACAGVDAELFLARSQNTARPDTPMGQGVVGRAIREKHAVSSNDITTEPGVGGERRKEATRRGYRSSISLPLLIEGAAVGNFSLFAKEANFFNADEVKLLTELAGDISFALEYIGKEEKLEKLSRIRAVSSEINSMIVRIGDRDALLRETCRVAAEHGKFELVWIALLDAKKQEVRPVAWTGFSPEAAHAVSGTTIGTARGTLGEAIQTRKVAIRNDIDAELPGGMLRQEALQKGCLSTVCLPLVVDDNVVALIALFAAGRGFFDEGELALLNEVAADVSFALQSIAKQEKLEYLSYYDVLTGLPNRHLFVDRLNQQMRSRSGEPQMVTLVLLDLERFRNINESLGHRGGDELLKTIARRLEHAFHGKDYLARIGSNAFGAIVRGMRDATGVVHVVENDVFTCFGQPFIVSDRELRVSVKAGIAIFPADGEDADNLFRNAEAALRQAKTSGNRYLFYAAEMNSRASQILALETRLRKAVEAEQFVLHYQPKLDFASGRISGLEALIRWNDPETGLVPPAQFIPLLEETGMIVGAGQWAIRRALADYREWQKEGLQPPRIAVNVSPVQLKRKDFVDLVRAAIGDSTAAAHGLDLEITESMIMEDIEGNIEKLRLLRDMGANTAIDDFGTGYSSLAYLAKLPVNALKIDRSFIVTMVDSPDSMTIISTIISLAHSLSLKVIAEGVETEEQSRFLKLLKCDEMQGYLFSKPLPAADIRTMLRERRGS